MSTVIVRWRPEAIYPTIDYRMADILKKRFGLPVTLTVGRVEFLAGCAAAGVPSAQELIDAIKEHEQIVVEPEP